MADTTTNINVMKVQEEGPTVSSTTKFTTDAEVVTSKLLSEKHLSGMYYKPSQVSYRQSIEEFLAKPVLIQNGVLSTTDSVSTFSQIVVPYDTLQAATSNIYENKLDGFLGFRATTVFRIVVNGNRFQQGRYMLTYVPLGGATSSNANSVASYNWHTNTLTARTQLQRVEIDVNCDTEGVIKLPFNSSLQFYPFSALVSGTGYGAWGILRLFPYASLVSPAGSTTASYSIYVSFEDVELIGPAGPQMGRMIKGKSKTEVEQDSVNIGPIESALTKVSSASTILAEVPMLSQIAAPVGWVSDILARSANVFGWSKPANLEPTHQVARDVIPNYFNYDAPDNGKVLAASTRNQVDVAPGFSGTDVDELDFAFVKTIPAYLNQFSWATSATAGTTLYSQFICPTATSLTRTVNTQTVYDALPVQFVANLFQQWRGTMVMNFKIVKTEFHSGRIAFCYFPYEDGDKAVNSSYLNSNYVFREIVDLRYQNEVTLTFPYINSLPWRPTVPPGSTPGQLVVYVIDPLVAPATVSSTVTILCEMAGGKDIEFSIPYTNHISQPIYNITPQMGDTTDTGALNECSAIESNIGGASFNDSDVTQSSYCVGESLTSFRQLLKLQMILPVGSYSVASNKFINLAPFAIPAVWSAATNQYPNLYCDLYGMLGAIYLYSRGGVRWKIVEAVPTQVRPARTYLSYAAPSVGNIFDIMRTSTSDATGATIIDAASFCPMAYHHLVQNLANEFTVPQYHKTHSRVNSEHLAGAGAGGLVYNLASTTSLATRIVVTHNNGSATVSAAPLFSRAGADDCNFGGFISIGPQVFTASTQTIA